MPWCAACNRFLSPSTVHVDGTGPTCGNTVDAGRAQPAPSVDATPAPGTQPDTDDPLDPVPWHFKLMLGALAIYLGYRALQGVEWVVHHL
ncbi:MAG TPA: hypothetical protein VLV81_14615 [Acidimicrobiia bacterium]|nr:hypothetical protein [Acidimicrobiia bacterium]